MHASVKSWKLLCYLVTDLWKHTFILMHIFHISISSLFLTTSYNKFEMSISLSILFEECQISWYLQEILSKVVVLQLILHFNSISTKQNKIWNRLIRIDKKQTISSTSNKQETPTFPNVVCPTEVNMNASVDAFFSKLLRPK